MPLIEDILHLVIQHCANDLPTLFNLLTVNRRAFYDTLPILYHDPFLAQPGTLQQYFVHRTSFSRQRLEYLIALCSGFLGQFLRLRWFDGSEFKPLWENAVMLPTMVDYSKYIKYYPGGKHHQTDIMSSFMSLLASSTPATKSSTATTTTTTTTTTISLCPRTSLTFIPPDYKCLAYLEWFGPKIRHLSLGSSLLPQLLSTSTITGTNKIQTLFENVQLLEFRPSSLTSLSVDELDNMIQFVKLHRQYFPTVLTQINLDNQQQHWDEYVKLNQELKEPKQIVVKSNAAWFGVSTWSRPVSLLGLPGSNVQVFEVQAKPNRPEVKDLARFLVTCRKLKVIKVNHSEPDMFKWASQERCVYDMLPYSVRIKLALWNSRISTQDNVNANNSNNKYKNKNNMIIDNHSNNQDIPALLVQLQHLIFGGHLEAIQDAMDGFRDSLVTVDFTHATAVVDEDQSLLLEWHWLMPQLISLRLSNHGVSCASLSLCPRLQKLELMDVVSRPEQPLWVPPVTLKELLLFGLSYERVDLSCLYQLVNLEKLVCCQCGQGEDDNRGGIVVDEDGQSCLSGERFDRVIQQWFFPRLKHVELVGAWAVQLQASLLAVSPGLETLTLKVLKRGKVRLNEASFGLSQVDVFENLKALILEGWCADVDGLKRQVVTKEHFPNLQDIRLNDFRALPTVGVEEECCGASSIKMGLSTLVPMLAIRG